MDSGYKNQKQQKGPLLISAKDATKIRKSKSPVNSLDVVATGTDDISSEEEAAIMLAKKRSLLSTEESGDPNARSSTEKKPNTEVAASYEDDMAKTEFVSKIAKVRAEVGDKVIADATPSIMATTGLQNPDAEATERYVDLVLRAAEFQGSALQFLRKLHEEEMEVNKIRKKHNLEQLTDPKKIYDKFIEDVAKDNDVSIAEVEKEAMASPQEEAVKSAELEELPSPESPAMDNEEANVDFEGTTTPEN